MKVGVLYERSTWTDLARLRLGNRCIYVMEIAAETEASARDRWEPLAQGLNKVWKREGQ